MFIVSKVGLEEGPTFSKAQSRVGEESSCPYISFQNMSVHCSMDRVAICESMGVLLCPVSLVSFICVLVN